MLGEVTVKAVEAVQTQLPMTCGAAILGVTRLTRRQRQRYFNECLPWALTCGRQAVFLYNIMYENRWHQDFEDLRRELRIPRPPTGVA